MEKAFSCISFFYTSVTMLAKVLGSCRADWSLWWTRRALSFFLQELKSPVPSNWVSSNLRLLIWFKFKPFPRFDSIPLDLNVSPTLIPLVMILAHFYTCLETQLNPNYNMAINQIKNRTRTNKLPWFGPNEEPTSSIQHCQFFIMKIKEEIHKLFSQENSQFSLSHCFPCSVFSL